jgi:superfamily II DNA or RNA helicase
VLNGQTSSREARNQTIDTFSRSQPGSLVLLCTKVCDVSIDFPVGCVIVQYHLTSGSRQQEVQRCGRGTRGSTGAIVYHILNQGTDEERFSKRRIEHLREEMWGKVEVDYKIADAEVQPSSDRPLASLMRIKIANSMASVLTKPSKNYGRLIRKNKSYSTS